MSGLHVGPAIFQEAIDVARLASYGVVGEEVFAAVLQESGRHDFPSVTDWRRAYAAGKLRFEALKLPARLQNQCIALTKALHLQFGAIDILLDTKGIYWFLEINPNGQWAFIEEDTGLPIGAAIAGLLESGAEKRSATGEQS